MATIGVERSLTNVQQALLDKGYNVVPIHNESDIKNCDCCVVSGVDSNIMGIQTAVIQGSVIEASGLTAEEVCQAVENKI
ncbi:YkuS family protein [Bacillus sp. FSL K6-3431]|uniref:YkuS family protein n=1 Tax=Bacillus sp. FSL K6-3431 TaxID=2921500 RepID=UPI0030F75E98